MGNIKLLKECSMVKGGHNELPTRPRPKTPPKGQGGKMSKYLLVEKRPKTTIMPVSQLVKAHKLVRKLLGLKLGERANKLLEELKDSITITY